MIRITDSIVLDDRDLTERFVRASGPGGENINKEATAVELRVDIQRSSLPTDLKKRLVALGGRQVTTDGVLVLVSRARRSQAQIVTPRAPDCWRSSSEPPKRQNPVKRRNRARPSAKRG